MASDGESSVTMSAYLSVEKVERLMQNNSNDFYLQN